MLVNSQLRTKTLSWGCGEKDKGKSRSAIRSLPEPIVIQNNGTPKKIVNKVQKKFGFQCNSWKVFEVLVEAWTLRRKTKQRGLKIIRNGILQIAEFNLASCLNDISRPSFQYAKL
ncbi:hypothetical protein H5410_035782 [Solanum commersonii]|uniref:Uncharacterized protein n=1 Tax=Solanum commersonii TaxID=4109 RepID=A0A9J5Y675_SOLCO|nr:hypothetical protein H5410_035782 [Solanum commersonii]